MGFTILQCWGMYLSEFKPETHPAIKDRKTKLKTISILKRKTSQLVKKLFIQSLKHFVYIYSSDSIFHYTYMYIQNVYLVYQSIKISELLWMFIHLLLSADRMYLLSILSRPIYTLFIFIATRHPYIIQGQYMYVICISLSWLRWSRVAPVIYDRYFRSSTSMNSPTSKYYEINLWWLQSWRSIIHMTRKTIKNEFGIYYFFFWTFSDLVDTCILAKIGLFYSSLLYLIQSTKMLFLSVHVSKQHKIALKYM